MCDQQEEVNELAVHPKGDYLAAADDSGTVKIYNTRTRRVEKTLRNAHTVSIPSLAGGDGGSGHSGVENIGVDHRLPFPLLPNESDTLLQPTRITMAQICVECVSNGLLQRVLSLVITG